ncbi:putative transcription factor/ chromatin remodeling BED-type(Zn) family [Helianthus annuus]|nr:putative transcription factor/ chromatin remodeling BED-type(Zn) family [Helianthus annuus]KAJ0828589.1 putative transcription factor/ chromatin remodeling BED-type(Zn) family [Helianthus annuus]
MSSYKESNENPAAHVDLTDGEDDPNPIIDESGDTDVADTATRRARSKERKKSSDVHPHFVDVQGLYKGKMVPKKQCIYCKHTYVRGNWSSTTSMKRHLQECGLFKKAQGQTPEDESQFQRTGNLQGMATGQPPNAMNQPPGKQVPFAQLLPVLEAQLDKDQAMQLEALYVRLKSNVINKEEFVRHTRQLVGDHTLKMALQQRQPTVGQKKTLEAPVSSLSKKQKVSEAFSDQSIDQQLNDVTAVSGVHLREEKEQLFSGSKEDSRVSEASRKVAQAPQKKLDEINVLTAAKRGVKNQSNGVERCLSQLEIVQAELEKEQKARQNIEARFEQFKQEREQERAEHERQREQERVKREQEREQERAKRERERAEQAEWHKNMEEILKKFLKRERAEQAERHKNLEEMLRKFLNK